MKCRYVGALRDVTSLAPLLFVVYKPYTAGIVAFMAILVSNLLDPSR